MSTGHLAVRQGNLVAGSTEIQRIWYGNICSLKSFRLLSQSMELFISHLKGLSSRLLFWPFFLMTVLYLWLSSHGSFWWPEKPNLSFFAIFEGISASRIAYFGPSWIGAYFFVDPLCLLKKNVYLMQIASRAFYLLFTSVLTALAVTIP